MSLKTLVTHEGRKSILVPSFIAACFFITGVIFGSNITSHEPYHNLQSIPPTHPINTTVTQPEPQDEPLGLKWLRAGHQNPWQFSTQRSSVDDLNASVTSLLATSGIPRVVVSFTSLPHRLAKHAPGLLHILKEQSYTPDMIYICIPYTSRRSNGSFEIPDWMTNDPLITVLRPEIDMGPATKLIPTLEAELALGNLETRIVTVDDDNEGSWSPDTLLELLAYSLHFPDAAVGFTGWNVTCMLSEARCMPDDSGVPMRQSVDWMYNFVRRADDYACHTLADWLEDYYANCLGAIRKNYIGYVDVLEGYKGIVYQPRFFNLFNLKSLLDDATPDWFFLCDDVWFSGWLGVQNVSRIVVNPAIHHDASVRLTLIQHSLARNLTVEKLSAKDMFVQKVEEEPEKGLHSIGKDFRTANLMGVRWFQERSAWIPDLWKRPAGFLYLSERNTSATVL